MKKIIKNQLAFLIMLIIVMVYSSITTKTFGQIVIKTLGSAVNAFTQIGPNKTRVSYAPGINTVLFVHRGDPAIAGSSGNKVMYDISANGGANWTNGLGPVIDLVAAGGLNPRYPQGYIMNPANNTTLTNARIVAAAPKATGVNNSWGRITSGMVTLAATGKKESLVSDSAFIPNSFVERIPGEYWMVSDTNSDGKITLYKGVYSLAGDSVLWTVALKLAKSRNLFVRSLNGKVNYVNPMVAFSPNGQIGWIATNGEIAGGAVDSALYPIFWSTTDGGQTWTGPQVVKLKNLSNVVASVNSNNPTATIDNDLVVDKNGNPHFAFVVAPKTTAYSYNNPTTFKYPIFDITKLNNTWTALKVDVVSTLNGTSIGALTHDNEIQLSRTKDGSKIFYSWTDTYNTSIYGPNSAPNLFIRGYNVDSNYFGQKISPTSTSSKNNLVYLPNTSDICSDLSPSGYKMHTVIATPTGDENVTVGFSYLDNLYYSFSNSSQSILPSYIPTSGLVGYYPFNGNAHDASGNLNDGTIVGGVSNTTDRFGNVNSALLFDGINGHIDVSSLNILAYRPITYSAWVIVNSYLPSTSGHKFRSIVGRNTAFVAENGVIGLYADNNVNGGAYNNTFLMWRGGGVTVSVPYSASIPALNTWIHIVYTQEINGDWKWYQNGILTNNGNFTNIQNDFNYFQIGGCNNQSLGNTYWNGKLDDIGIWNRALTQSEITALYNQAPYQALPSYVPTASLVAYYPFNGNANDASGNNNNGTVNGATLTTDKSGNLNSAYSFTGTETITGNCSNYPALNSSRTISLWYNANNITSAATQLMGYGGGTCGESWIMNFNNYDIPSGRYEVQGHCLAFRNHTASPTPLNNTWHNIVVSYDGSVLRFYNDGVLVKTSTSTSLNTIVNAKIFCIGKQVYSDGLTAYIDAAWPGFSGKLDDIGIWNRALTQSEITALYNQAPTSVIPSNVPTSGLVAYYPFNGNANDLSGNGNNGTVNGASMTTDRLGASNSAYSFDGLSNEISITNSLLNLGANFTISCWMSSSDITKIQQCLFNSISHTGFVVELNNENIPTNKLMYGVGNSVAFWNLIYAQGTASNYQNSIWYHVVFSKTSTQYSLYVNNVFDGSSVVSASTSYNQNVGLRIGSIGGSEFFKGKLDDFGIWNRALTQSEITALYNTPTAAASDSLWVINKQTDTLVFPSQVKLSLKSNNITSKNISAYDIKLNYDASKLKFDSVTKTNTASANGSVIVNSATTGQVIIGWASSSSISSTSLPLLNCFFTPIDSGKTTVSISNAIFNTDTVKNRYSKSVINKFNFGDVDMNKIIQSYDASLVLKYSVGMDPLPTIDPLPWEPWRIKIASVDTTIAVNANDASLILKYSVGLITKFPKRGIASAPGYVTVNLENNELVVRSFEDMGGLNITFLDHLSDLGAPTYVHNTNALSAFNKQANMYKIGVAFSEAPVNGTVILRIPYTGLGNQTLNMELVENTAARNYQLNVVTGINDIKNSNIKIYPNPTNNIINIEGLTKNENNTIQIFDVQGKLVITKTIAEKGTIDLSELNKGVYVIKIGEVAQRIVKM